MAGVKISGLPPVATSLTTDFFPVVQGGITKRETLTQVGTLFGFTAGILAVTNGGTGLSSTTANQLLYSSGSNVIAGLATSNSAILRTNASGIPAWSASLTNGQILIGSTGATPTPSTISPGPGISISNGAGSITISGTGSGIGWTEVTSASQLMVADNGYVTNNAGLVTLTLPATAAFGTAINVIGKGAGGWSIAQNAGQSVQIGSVSSTIGVGGSVSSTNSFDSLELICTTANTIWTAMGAGQSAGFTIV